MAAVATPSAAARTLAVPELLENILLFADPIQLFALQRVNTTFKDVISDSTATQQRMLLDPDHVPSIKTAKQILKDARLQYVIHPFMVDDVFDDSFHVRVLSLHIKHESVLENQDKKRYNMEWTGASLLHGHESWRRINITSPWENRVSMSVHHPNPDYQAGEIVEIWLGGTGEGPGMDLGQMVWEATGLCESYWSDEDFRTERFLAERRLENSFYLSWIGDQ